MNTVENFSCINSTNNGMVWMSLITVDTMHIIIPSHIVLDVSFIVLDVSFTSFLCSLENHDMATSSSPLGLMLNLW